MKYKTSLGLYLLSLVSLVTSLGILYPRPSETRDQISLDGIWNFVLAPPEDVDYGVTNKWYEQELTTLEDVELYQMPVPSSYNDITVETKLRDHSGTVWYDRTFFVPFSWPSSTLVWLRIGAIANTAKVYLNGKLVVSHDLAHLPFTQEVSSSLNYGSVNHISIEIDNRYKIYSIPQMSLKNDTTDDGSIRYWNQYNWDYFNYAGIHRSVILYTTPKLYIDDVLATSSIRTVDDDTIGILNYKVNTSSFNKNVNLNVNLMDKTGEVSSTIVSQAQTDFGFEGVLLIPKVKLWWPYLMDENPGYMYTLEVKLVDENNEVLDVYRQPIGIRTIEWTNTELLVNGRPVYLRGFGRHEDSDFRGRGFDLAVTLRDYNLIKWIGANAYRTSYYPYSEEIMDLADQMGIMIINECPAINLHKYDVSVKLMANHKESLAELISRDKNRPSVIMWSLASDPNTLDEDDEWYFEEIVSHVKNLDPTRPVTMSVHKSIEETSLRFMDVVSLNRFYAWETYDGQLDMIKNQIMGDVRLFRETFNKPVLVSEYGADTVPGYHSLPSFVWSEEYQDQFLSKYFKAFDELRQEKGFIGEFVWNFADFETQQNYRRVGGSKKGIFSRNRQPKSSAYLLRRRYWALANEYDNAAVPRDLDTYVSSNYNTLKIEL